jgi:hypothetical protein
MVVTCGTPIPRILCISFILVISSMLCFAQVNYKGIWQGYITAPGSYTSGYAINIEESTGDRISGTAYIYRNENPIQFIGELDFIGTTSKFGSKITELVIVKEKMPDTLRRLCVKYMDLDFTQKDSLDYLTGNWDGSLTDHSPCLPGKVYLRRHNPAAPEGIEPIPEDILKAIKADKSSKMHFLNTELAKPILINVKNSDLKFEIRDYLKEDMDTVSIYLNRKVIIKKLGILKKSFKQAVRLDRNSELHEIILYAENLGQIPPNTSILTIIDGETKHKLIISSTSEISAVIYLRYVPDGI